MLFHLLKAVLLSALSIPPHARVNSRCYPVWNADKSNLQLVWDGTTYSNPFHSFNAEPTHTTDSYTEKKSVQKLFCTDNGVAGRWSYRAHNDGEWLHAAWLSDPSVRYKHQLLPPYGSGASTSSEGIQSGPITIVGNTLYYLTSYECYHCYIQSTL